MTLCQSSYPLKTIFKGDSVVILKVQQADEINRIFERQKTEINELKNEIENLKKVQLHKDSIINDNQLIVSINDDIAKRLDTLEHWMYWASIEGSWIYFSYEDSLMYRMDLSKYKVSKDNETGDLFFYYNDEFDRNPESKDFFINQQSPELNWQFVIRRSRRPKIEVVPIKQ